MNSPRDQILITATLIALTLGAFVAGWWTGNAGAVLDAHEQRLARLERVDVAPAPRAQARAPQEARPANPTAAARTNIVVDTEGAPALGPADAPVTLVAFSDFACPYCSRVVPTLEQLHEAYPEQLRIVFKHFPLPMHPQAMAAHEAAQAALAQGAFWPMHDRIFAAPKDMAPETLRGYAEALGLDLAAYDEALASDALRARVRADIADGQGAGVTGTPSFVLGGRLVTGAQPFAAMQAEVEDALEQAARRNVAMAGGRR